MANTVKAATPAADSQQVLEADDDPVVGNDLSAIQPTMIPPNVKFEIDDVESEWTNGTFDYIHGRYLAGALKDWLKLVRQDTPAPTASPNYKDFDFHTFSDDDTLLATSFHKWNQLMRKGLHKGGYEARPDHHLER
ncbi:MAG: hypothetical protein M1833_005906 [Piccolia ochrophora]|nr:MAG: hypothetical protein M1833_005906 [Piccolia ochrophora]